MTELQSAEPPHHPPSRSTDLLELTAKLADAINAGDLDALEALFHPDLVFKSSGDEEPLDTVDAVMMFYEAMIEAGIRVSIVQQNVNEPYIFSEFDVRQRRSDGVVTERRTFVRHRWSDGLLVERRSFSDQPRVVGDAWE